MSELQEYLDRRGVTEGEMAEARQRLSRVLEAYDLRQARKSCHLTQAQVAREIGVSQNRISRMENGDLGTIGIDALRRYITALGGRLLLVAELPDGTVVLE